MRSTDFGTYYKLLFLKKQEFAKGGRKNDRIGGGSGGGAVFDMHMQRQKVIEAFIATSKAPSEAHIRARDRACDALFKVENNFDDNSKYKC